MQTIIRRLKKFGQAKKGVSNVIVIMLSLILIVLIVGNVVLWSYQMNQFDLERMQENIRIANVSRVTRSPWFATQSEYKIIAGSRLSGTYTETKFLDGASETFREEKTQIFNPGGYILGGSTRYVSGNVSDLMSNDEGYMSFRSYPNYEFRYEESLEISSTTSTAYQDKVSIEFAPQITAEFIIIASAEVQGSSTTYQAKARLTINSTTCQELVYRVKDASDWYPFCGLKRITLNQGTSYSIKIQFCTSSTGATASIKNAKIVLMSIPAEYAESEELSTTSSTAWQDKVTLAFTPSTNGEYLIIATANYEGSSTNRDVNIRLIQDDAIVYAEAIGRPGSGTINNYYTFGVMKKVNLNATHHTFKIQYCSSGAPGIAGINYAHIVAIKLSEFESNYYSEDENESIPAVSNIWYDKVVNNYFAESGNYLIMGSVAYKSGSTSYSVGLDFQTEFTSRQSPLVEQRAVTNYEYVFFMTMQMLEDGSKTDKIRYMGESTNARVKDARLISCKMPTLTQTAEVEFFGTSNTQNWTQIDWTIDSCFTTQDVTTIFQLYNYQANEYPTSGDGYLTDVIGLVDVTKNQTITANSTNYRDEEGNWKVKIKGVKATEIQFELKIDWIEFKATTSNIYRLNINNNFIIDLSTYPLNYVQGIEIYIRYNATEGIEKWFLRAYNWTELNFSNVGFNVTEGSQPAPNHWNEYAVNITENWRSYVRDDGALLIEFSDEGLDANQTVVEIDFFAVRAIIDGASFDLRNNCPITTHIVSIWIINSTSHQRYNANFFINAGEEAIYIRADISLPEEFIAKVVTERGNIAVFTQS